MRLSPFASRAIVWAALAAVALFALYAMAPVGAIPTAPVWVEVYLPVVLFGSLFVAVLWAINHDTVNAVVGALTLVTLGGLFLFQAFVAYAVLTF